MLRTVLVITILLGNPPEWQEFRVPLTTQADCHRLLVERQRTPEAHKPGVLFHCAKRTDQDPAVASTATAER